MFLGDAPGQSQRFGARRRIANPRIGRRQRLIRQQREQAVIGYRNGVKGRSVTRTAHDRQLPGLYARLLTELGGASSERDNLPDAIGSAALGGTGKVPIGNGKVMNVSPPLAFDAGFAVGYKDRGAKSPGRANPEQLKMLSENCLAGTAAYGACFSAGYMYGAKAAGG